MQIDGIQAVVSLQNNMSKPFQTIINSIQNVISTLNIMNSTRVDLNTSQITAVNTMMRDTQANLVQLNRELGNGIQENTNQQAKFNNQLKNGLNPANKLLGTIKSMVGAYSVMRIGKGLFDVSSEMTDSLARLDIMNDGKQTTEQLNKMITQSGLNTYSDYKGTLDMVTQFQITGGERFKSNQEAIAFAEQVNKHLAMSGTSEAGRNSMMTQLPQAFAKGALRGQELNTVFEQTPTMIQALATHLGKTTGELREMAEKGQLTADVIKNAMFATADDTNKKFEQMPITLKDLSKNFATIFKTSLQPIFNTLENLANNKGFQVMLYSTAKALAVIANLGFNAFTMLASGIGFVTRNLNIVIPLLGVLTAALIIANGAAIAKFYTDKKALIVEKAQALWTGIRTAAMTTLTTVQWGAAAAVSLFTGATVAQTAAQWGLNAAMLANPVGLIIVGIMLLIGLFFGAIAAINKFAGTSISAFGVILGYVMFVGAMMVNPFIAAYNIIGTIFVGTYNVIATVIEMILNKFGWLFTGINRIFMTIKEVVGSIGTFMVDIFKEAIQKIKMFFIDLGSQVLKLFENIGSLIDKVLGSNMGQKVLDLKKQLKDWAENTDRDYKIPKIDFERKELLNPFSMAEKGYNVGENFGNNIAGLKDKFVNPMGDNDMLNLLKGIEKNTGATSTKLGLTTEEIKYLRDVAEQEVINRYTTASVKVEMTNNNNINSDADADGLITKFYNGIAEAASTVAEGV